jgi:hypothetical protein
VRIGRKEDFDLSKKTALRAVFPMSNSGWVMTNDLITSMIGQTKLHIQRFIAPPHLIRGLPSSLVAIHLDPQEGDCWEGVREGERASADGTGRSVQAMASKRLVSP